MLRCISSLFDLNTVVCPSVCLVCNNNCVVKEMGSNYSEKLVEILDLSCNVVSSACILNLSEGHEEGFPSSALCHEEGLLQFGRDYTWSTNVNMPDRRAFPTHSHFNRAERDQGQGDMRRLHTSLDYTSLDSLTVGTTDDIAPAPVVATFDRISSVCVRTPFEDDGTVGRDETESDELSTLRLCSFEQCGDNYLAHDLSDEFELNSMDMDILEKMESKKTMDRNRGPWEFKDNDKGNEVNIVKSESTSCSGSEALSDVSRLSCEPVLKNDEKSGKIGKVKRQARRYVKPRRSRYCHLCARHERCVRMVGCTNIMQRTCQKSVCVKCIETYQLDVTVIDWKCPHCQRNCPSRAKCFSYDKQTAERREKSRRAKSAARLKREQHAQKLEHRRQ